MRQTRRYLSLKIWCVVLDDKGEGSESPDELALVHAAADVGWSFQHRKSDELNVMANSEERTGQILGINAFTFTRKRMSLLVRSYTGEHILWGKGADYIIMSVPACLKDQLLAGLYRTRQTLDFFLASHGGGAGSMGPSVQPRSQFKRKKQP